MGRWKKGYFLLLALVLTFAPLFGGYEASANTNGILQGVVPDGTSITQLTDGSNSSYSMAANSTLTWSFGSPKNIKGYYLHSNGTTAGSALEFYDGDTLLGSVNPNAYGNANYLGNFFFPTNFSNVSKIVLRNKLATALPVYDLDVTEQNVLSPYDGSVLTGLTGQYTSSSLTPGTSVNTVTNTLYDNHHAVANNWFLYWTLPSIKTVNTYSFYALYGNGEIQLFDENKVLLQTVPVTSRKGDRITFTPVTNVKYIQWKNTSGTTAYVSQFHVVELNQDITPPSNVSSLQGSLDPSTGNATLSWSKSPDIDLQEYRVYLDGVLHGATTSTASTVEYALSGLQANQIYSVKVTSVDATGNESSGSTVMLSSDTIPPAEITALSVIKSADSLSFTWTDPVEDFDHVNVYRDGVFLASAVGGFADSGLTPSTSYNYVFKTVDASGNESSGYISTVETDFAPVVLTSPTNVQVFSGNGSLTVTFNAVNHSDLQGYQVYLDGLPYDSVTSNTTVNITGLTNDQTYSVRVASVALDGTETVPSASVSGTPSQTAMPFIGISYSLSDLADNVSSWFSNLWLIVAFSCSIPLVFVIGRNIKTLFTS